MKPELKYEEGVLTVEANLSTQVDADKDGKPSVVVSAPIALKIDAAEAVTEIAKKDMPLIESILKNLKLSL